MSEVRQCVIGLPLSFVFFSSSAFAFQPVLSSQPFLFISPSDLRLSATSRSPASHVRYVPRNALLKEPPLTLAIKAQRVCLFVPERFVLCSHFVPIVSKDVEPSFDD
jgi:hypothetical protein